MSVRNASGNCPAEEKTRRSYHEYLMRVITKKSLEVCIFALEISRRACGTPKISTCGAKLTFIFLPEKI
jgi:hypothetical protein